DSGTERSAVRMAGAYITSVTGTCSHIQNRPGLRSRRPDGRGVTVPRRPLGARPAGLAGGAPTSAGGARERTRPDSSLPESSGLAAGFERAPSRGDAPGAPVPRPEVA